MRAALVLSLLLSFNLFAQDGAPEEPFNCDPYNPPEWVKTDFDKFFVATACLDWRVNYVLNNERELEYFGDKYEVERVKSFFDHVLETYPILVKTCEDNNFSTDDCKVFSTRGYQHNRIKLSYLHMLMLLKDGELLDRWLDNMEHADVNKIAYPSMVMNSTLRYSLAEIAAGHPQSSLAVLKTLLDRGMLSFKTNESFPLHAAIVNGKNDRALFLIENGADVNRLDNKDYCQYLSDKDCYVSNKGETGMSPLHRTVTYNNKKLFDRLLSEEGINVNIQNSIRGETPMMFAAHEVLYDKDNPERAYFFDTLLEHADIDVNIQFPSGQTYLNFVVSYIMLMGASENKSFLITDFLNHPGFDVAKHCNERNHCFQPIVRSTSDKVLLLFKPIASSIDFNARRFNHGKRSQLSLIGLAQSLKNTAPNKQGANRMKKIIKILKKWKNKYN